MEDMMVMMLQSSIITTEIDGGIIRVPALITENQVEDLVWVELEAPAVVVVQVEGTQPEADPGEEVVQEEEVAQVVAVDLVVDGLVVADNPSEKYLN